MPSKEANIPALPIIFCTQCTAVHHVKERLYNRMNQQKNPLCIFGHAVDIPARDAYHRHMHNEYEILLFIRGSAQYRIEGTTYNLMPGDLLFIRPRIFHYLIPQDIVEYERCVVQFSDDVIPDELRSVAATTTEIRNLPQGDHLRRVFDRVCEAQSFVTAGELTLLIHNLIVEVLIALKYAPVDPVSRPMRRNDALADILRYIDEHPNDPLRAQVLADRFFVSRSWIEHIFRDQLGITVQQYVSKKRILYAQGLIKGGLSPTLTAEQCHYDNYATFYRNYKKILQRSPEEDARR